MEKNKTVLLVMPHMMGGGAERVASQLMNKFVDSGYDTVFLLTKAKRDAVIRTDLGEKTTLRLLTEEMKKETVAEKLRYLPMRAYATLFGKLYEMRKKDAPPSIGKAAVLWQYHREIRCVRNELQKNPEMTAIAFLQPAIPILMLAGASLPNRVLFSERGDPHRLMKKRYGRRFIEKYYTRADAAVFQTEDAKAAYPESVSKKGAVIPNPIKEGLPTPYTGERHKTITTFCRISKQKNLPLLVEAFASVHERHPDYILRVIGDAGNDEGEAVLQTLYAQVDALGLRDAVRFEPFMKNVHEAILRDAMYVNSSDYEGISNAMLEAMAIGMPVVCTDCPIGGAKATITDGENGLLTPIGDAQTLAAAIDRLIEEPTLSKRLSENASKIRETLSLDHIAKRWEALL